MDKGKLNRILERMKEQGMPQMIITDPVAIFYLTGKWIFPGERMLALYINIDGRSNLFVNKMLPQEKDLGVEIS